MSSLVIIFHASITEVFFFKKNNKKTDKRVRSLSFTFLTSLRARNGKSAMRDIVQFVPYRDYQYVSKCDVQIAFVWNYIF